MFTESLESNKINFQGYNSWSYNDLLVNDGRLYFASQASTTFVKFGIPIFGLEYDYVSCSPFRVPIARLAAAQAAIAEEK